MTSLFDILYNAVFLPLLLFSSRIAALADPKIRRGLRGRKALFSRLEKATADWGDAPRFWIHNSSMGEFEQAKPIVLKLKERFPDCRVVVSFFSPSGLEHVGDYAEADLLCYLPADTRTNARRFIRTIRPSAALVIRHDLWPNHLKALNRNNIPAFLVNCSIRHEKYLKIPGIRQANRFLFGCFDEVLAVSEETVLLFRRYRLGRAGALCVGDTRYDQVVRRAQTAEAVIAPLRRIKGNRITFVMGSTWPSDEAVLSEALGRLKADGILPWMIMVPHEPTEDHLRRLESHLHAMDLKSRRLSRLESRNMDSEDVLLVDRIGILASLYALGEIAFVGGGFGPGVHNVLEPAALGKVVLFGPRSTNSYEAGQLLKRGVGFVVRDGESLYRILHDFLHDSGALTRLGFAAVELVTANAGATERIVSRVAARVRHP